MATLPPSRVKSQSDLLHFSSQLLTRWITQLDREKIRLHLPRRRGLMRLIPDAPFHLHTELFLQLSGCTTFHFPEETCRVGPGELCLVSRGLPHREKIRAGRGPFFNMVISYYADLIHVHLARESDQGLPVIVVSVDLPSLDGARLTDLLKDLADWAQEDDRSHRFAIKGSLIANLSSVLMAIQAPRKSTQEPLKVMQARQLIMRNLSHPGMSASWIGRQLRSSPDYLSRLFREATGKPLAAYITGRQMIRACDLLASSTLNISEISRTSGYEDPSYFSRVFRKEIGLSPRQYRDRALHAFEESAAGPIQEAG